MTVGDSGLYQVLAMIVYGRELGFRVVGFVFDQLNARAAKESAQ